MVGPWTPEAFEANDGTILYERFMEDLSDFKCVALDTAVERVLAARGLDLIPTE